MHPTELQLNDYVDGVLSNTELRAVDQHIASCATCAREVEALRALTRRVAALPRSITPERDLRPEIRARMKQRGPLWNVRYQLAAAAVILVALSSMLTVSIVNRTRPSGFTDDRAHVRLIRRDAHALQREYSAEVRELEMVLRKSRGALSPSTVRILEDNLKIIDNAIREAQTAIAADPNSEMLIDLLRSAYERKLELLRQAAKSSPVTT